MPVFQVSIPVFVHVTVEADSEEQITPAMVEAASMDTHGKYAQVRLDEITDPDEYTVLGEV